MKSIRDRIKEAKQEEINERIANKEYFRSGVWWKSKEEFDRVIRLEFKKLDKNDYRYKNNLETLRQYYGLRKIELIQYIS